MTNHDNTKYVANIKNILCKTIVIIYYHPLTNLQIQLIVCMFNSNNTFYEK